METAERLKVEADERKVWQQLAEEVEAEQFRTRRELEALQQEATQKPAAEIHKLEVLANEAASQINIDEAATRELIDPQLRDAGWEADTKAMRWADGARPARGHSRAIAEWPTSSGPADYALFVGTQLVATVEAKRKNTNVMSVLPQGERYARDIDTTALQLSECAPWGEFKAPFAFATNGRPYLKQLETASGKLGRSAWGSQRSFRTSAFWTYPRQPRMTAFRHECNPKSRPLSELVQPELH